MTGKKNPPFAFITVPADAPFTFERIAQASLADYVLQRYRTLNPIRPGSTTCAPSSAEGWPRPSRPMRSVSTSSMERRGAARRLSLPPTTIVVGTIVTTIGESRDAGPRL